MNRLIPKLFIVVIPIILSPLLYGYSFEEMVKIIKNHVLLESLENKSKAFAKEGKIQGSWGDPVFRVWAKNFPADLRYDQTPMTGIEFSLSQKIPLTTKYKKIENSFLLLAQAKQHETDNKAAELIKWLWEVLIEDKKISKEIIIIKENINWIDNTLAVSKKLYAAGQLNQQSLLDIQIRKSELEALLSNKVFESKQQLSRLSYLIDEQVEFIAKDTIPWSILAQENSDSQYIDYKELSLKAKLSAKHKMLIAKQLNQVPDFTLFFAYTLRANIDNRGDFLSASIGIPFPFSGQRAASHSHAVFEKTATEKELENYQKLKQSQKNYIRQQLTKLTTELKILNEKTIKFAESVREIVAKSYALGNSTYIELLQSEFKLQDLLLKRINLDADLMRSKVDYKYLLGEKLHE